MKTLYNEWDRHAAAWLRELIKSDLISDGRVDERSITELQAEELREYERIHFFAGIAGWELALDRAGWQREWPVWTASLPCQPWSTAGKQLGKDDERHLLPQFVELVRGLEPRIIFGEQVANAIRHGWLDDLCDTMEAEGYTVRAAVLTAAGQGAPHIRQRLYWAAIDQSWLSNPLCGRQQGQGQLGRPCDTEKDKNREIHRIVDACRDNDRLGNTKLHGFDASSFGRSPSQSENESRMQQLERPNTDYKDIEWVECRDGKSRPIKTNLKPTAVSMATRFPGGMVRDGNQGEPLNAEETSEARQIRLKGYGNAIQIDTAIFFIQSVMRYISQNKCDFNSIN